MMRHLLTYSFIMHNGYDFHQGDSGGPLTEQQGQGKAVKQVGVVSFGSSAGCEKGAPVGFARVSSFYDWIAANAGLPNTDCP